MGSSESSDSQVQLFTSLSKPLYYAGQIVEGIAHINCFADRPYQFLQLRLIGRQQTDWYEGTEQTQAKKHREKRQKNKRRHYERKKDTYNQIIPLTQFQGGLKQGQYSFPFSFMLPTALPSSFTLTMPGNRGGSTRNFIEYELETWLTSGGTNTVFRKTLNIRQPPRNMGLNLIGQATCQSNCSICCCYTMGHTALSLATDVSHLQQGKNFHVRGSIDNSTGQTELMGFKVLLRQRIRLAGSPETLLFSSNELHVRNFNEDVVLYRNNKSVPAGNTEQFEASLTLPQRTLSWYTAIGSLLSKSYYLVLEAQACCCYDNPRLEMHTVLTSPAIPMPGPNDQIPAPPNWYPQVFPLISAQLKPYVYQPQKVIVVSNQGGRQIYGQEMANFTSANMMHRN